MRGERDGGHDGGDTRLRAYRRGQLVQGLGVDLSLLLGHELQGTVEPGAEAGRQQVVGLAGRRVGRVVALVRGAEPEREERHGHEEHHEEGYDGRNDGLTLDEVRPPGPEPLGAGADDAGAVGGEVLLLLPAEHAGADEAQQGG